MLFKEFVDGRTHGRTDGRRTPDIEGSQKLTEHFVLRWAKKSAVYTGRGFLSLRNIGPGRVLMGHVRSSPSITNASKPRV